MEAVSARRPRVHGLALPGRRATGLALPLALTVVAGALRLWGLGRQGFWYDEATTAWLLRGTPVEVLQRLPHTESTPPLYYLFGWVWVRLFGDSEVGLRSLSALAGAAAVPVTFMAARELVGRRAAGLAGLLVAVNPLLVWYSQEARAYSLLVLASAVSLWLFARARSDPTRARLVGWGVAAAAAVCVHYFAVFLVLPEALLVLALRRAPPRARLLSVGIPAAASAALVVLANAQSGRIYRWTNIPLPLRVRQVMEYFVVGFSPPAGLAVFAVAALAVTAALVLLLRSTRVERRAVAPVAGVAATAVLLPVLLAGVGIDYFNARNEIGAVVPLAVVVAAGLGAARSRVLAGGLAATLAALSIAMVAGTERDVYAQRPHWQEVAEALAYRGTPRAILLLRGRTWSRPLGFYLPHTWWAPAGGKPVRELDVLRKISHNGPCPTGVWWGALCNITPHGRLRAAPAGFHLVSSERVDGFAIDRYQAARAIRVYPRWPIEKAGARGQRTLMVTPTAAPRTP